MRTALAHAAAGGDAFLYRFDWAPSGEFADLGASHAFDEAFVWNVPKAFPPAAEDPAAPDLAGEMSSALLKFARDSAPGWETFASTRAARLFGGAATSRGDEDLLRAWEGIEKR
jgi:carboxylesterase type B